MLSTNIALLVGALLSFLLTLHLYKILTNVDKTTGDKILWSFLTVVIGTIILLFVMPFIQIALRSAGIN